jgi:cyclomaltodextrinase
MCFGASSAPLCAALIPDAVIIGEIWDDAGRWLQGDMFDSVMNYVWRGAVLGFVAHRSLTPSQFDQRMAQLQVMYPRQSLYAMYNMLSSHDTPRFRRECGGDLNRVRLGLLLQFTAIGAPAIYYGDEIGMDGGGIPDNRRPMRFERTPDEQALFEYTRALIALRKGSVALRRATGRPCWWTMRAGCTALCATPQATPHLCWSTLATNPSAPPCPRGTASPSGRTP